jgi:hypothetical protein
MSGTGASVVHGVDGIILGAPQIATGSHTGFIDGSESPGIDIWQFYRNTGMHFTVNSGISILSDDGAGHVILDFSNWRVTWNGIPSINMGEGAHGGFTDGQAVMTCSNTCENGDSYTLEYRATVPAGDPSNFGGVAYSFYVVSGAIIVPEPVTSSDTIQPGALGLDKIRLTKEELTTAIGIEDQEFTPVGGYFDFTVTDLAGSTQVRIPLTTPIPDGAVYRKFVNSAFTSFTPDASNLIASAARIAGTCPEVGDAAYAHSNGLVAGHGCVQLTLEDNGPYDSDNTTGIISDPGGIAIPINEPQDARTSGIAGCSITAKPSLARHHADWGLVVIFMALLGLLRHRKKIC